MNLLTEKFISTTGGKISLKQVLTSSGHELKYAFDETQLAMLQLLSSLSTVVLKPTMNDLRHYLQYGVTETEYDKGLENVDLQLFEDDRFMRSSGSGKSFGAPVTKLISGIECGKSCNAMGLFSEVSNAEVICPHCAPVLNYNLHMNIRAEPFSSTGATGIRGGGNLSTLVAKDSLGKTILANTVASDFFENHERANDADSRLMWESPPEGDVYFAHKIGLERGLFALAYHIDFELLEEPCICDVCGNHSEQSIKEFSRKKYTGVYGSTKNGREGGAGWWPHPYTPTTKKEEGVFPLAAKGQEWQSWQHFASYVINKETEKSLSFPAPIVQQYKELNLGHANLLVGGNIADQGSVIGRVYDLYSMPENWNSSLERVTKVIDEGLMVKEALSRSLNKIFGIGYAEHFVSGIKKNAIQQFDSNAQIILQSLLLDINRKEATKLRKNAFTSLRNEAFSIHQSLTRKYQNDLALFKALNMGESALRSLKGG